MIARLIRVGSSEQVVSAAVAAAQVPTRPVQAVAVAQVAAQVMQAVAAGHVAAAQEPVAAQAMVDAQALMAPMTRTGLLPILMATTVPLAAVASAVSST